MKIVNVNNFFTIHTVARAESCTPIGWGSNLTITIGLVPYLHRKMPFVVNKKKYTHPKSNFSCKNFKTSVFDVRIVLSYVKWILILSEIRFCSMTIQHAILAMSEGGLCFVAKQFMEMNYIICCWIDIIRQLLWHWIVTSLYVFDFVFVKLYLQIESIHVSKTWYQFSCPHYKCV